VSVRPVLLGLTGTSRQHMAFKALVDQMAHLKATICGRSG
jgi:hypothetical protein